MPGIAGVINFEDTPNSERVVDAMVASMQNERFYVSGTHATPEMGTYVGWAAHKNSFATSQLFLNEQHDIALIVAGECFVDSNTLIGLIKRDIGLKTRTIGLFTYTKRKGSNSLRN